MAQMQVKPAIRIEEGAFAPVRSKQAFVWQIVRFGISGGCNAGIDLLALNILLWRFPTQNAALLVLYNTLAYALGALNSYLLNKYWTFRRNQGITGDELARFITINIIGILCNDAIFWIIAKEQSFYPASSFLLTNLAKIGAIIGTAGISYIGMHLWVFKHASHKQERE